MPRQATFVWSAVVFLVTLTLYIFSMPVTITLEDAGLFQMVCNKGGIGHPPGYPLFVLSCQGFVALPFFETGVFAGNLLSAIFASLACALLVPVFADLFGEKWLAVFTAIAYGLSATFWSQAIVIEVYSLAVLLFVCSLWLCLHYRRTEDTRTLYLLAFFYGLALSNHWPLQLLASPALLVIVLPKWHRLVACLRQPIHLLGLIAVSLAGLLPYLSLLQASPEMAVYGSIETWEQFVNYVSRAPYDDQFEVAGWHDRGQYQLWVLLQTLTEFSYPLAPLVMIGLFISFRVLGSNLALSFLFLHLGATSLLIMLLGFEFSELRAAIFRPYPLIAYLGPVVWLGLGCRWLLDVLRPFATRIVFFIPPALLVAELIQNLPDNYRRDDRFALNYAEKVFELTPPGSILFVTGDTGVGVLGYLHHVEGIRPDIELRSWNNLVFSNRLTSAFAPQKVLDAARREFIEESEKRVLSNTQPDYPATSRGLVFEKTDHAGFECSSGLHSYIRQLLKIDTEAGLLLDGHERELLFGLLVEFTRQHLGLVMFRGNVSGEELQMLQELQVSFSGKLGTLESVLRYPQGARGKALLRQMAEATVRETPKGISSQVAGLIDEYRGRIALIEPSDHQAAVVHFESSLEKFPTRTNASRCVLPDIYELLGDVSAADRVRAAYGSCE